MSRCLKPTLDDLALKNEEIVTVKKETSLMEKLATTTVIIVSFHEKGFSLAKEKHNQSAFRPTVNRILITFSDHQQKSL